MAKAEARLTTNSAITVTDLNTTVNCEPRVHDLRLAEALGFSDRHMIRALIRRHLPTLRTFGEVFAERKKPSGSGGRPGTDYYLNKRQALFVTAKSDTERAALVTVQMVEVFDAVTSGSAPVKVREHRRRPPEASLSRAGADGQGAVLVDGVLVRFDARRKPSAGELAVVMRGDGTLVVNPIPADGFGRERAAVIGAVVKGGPAKPAAPPLLPGRVSERLLRTYASWLHMEYGRLCEEIERQGGAGRLGVGLGITNPGYWYHMPSAGEILEPPSARAALVLKAVGCPIPVPRPPGAER